MLPQQIRHVFGCARLVRVGAEVLPAHKIQEWYVVSGRRLLLEGACGSEGGRIGKASGETPDMDDRHVAFGEPGIHLLLEPVKSIIPNARRRCNRKPICQDSFRAIDDEPAAILTNLDNLS